VALTIDWENQLINVTSPQTDVLVQDLIDFIRTEEPSSDGIAYSKVADATGKDSLGGATSTGITLTLLDNWQLKFWDGNYTATISGGNLLGGPSGDPVAYTAGVQVVVIQSAASTLVVTGSGVSPSDITDIADAVWDEAIAQHLAIGSTGEKLNDAGAAGSPPTVEQIADAVWDEAAAAHVVGGSFGALLALILNDTESSIPALISAVDGKIDSIQAVVDIIVRLTGNKVTASGDIITIFEADGVTPWRQYDLANGGRVQL
jgi:hypothetical protein